MRFAIWLLGACVDGRESTHGSPHAARSEAPVEELPGSDTPDGGDGGGDDGEDDVGDYESFFDPATLRDIHLYASEETIEALNADGGTYMPGTFVHDGVELEVGLRLKGQSSYRTFEKKPALKVKFNEFVAGQRYAGLKRIALNNLTGDPAQGREVAAYWVWRAGGMDVPSAALARVYVNDEYFGLYALVEGMDDVWVERHYADASGVLWAGNDDADLTALGIPHFAVQTSEGDAPLSLEQVAAGIARTDADFYTVASRVVDVEQYLDYVAWSSATGNTDGYPWHLDDFFVYGDPAEGGRLNFVPWGQDETWEETWTEWTGHAVIAQRCHEDLDCRTRIDDHTRAVLGVYESMDVRGFLEALFDLSEDATATDGRREFTLEEVRAARALLLQSAETWPDRVRAEMEL
ncbi:MAG: CotH kinase family protein [Myxococcota bacterium]